MTHHLQGNSVHASDGNGKIFDEGKEFAGSAEIEKFCKGTLNKTFDNWVLIGRDIDQKSYKELEGGDLVNGMVVCNLNQKGRKSELGQKSRISNFDEKGSFAMMVLDAVEAVCDDEQEIEDFLDALSQTAKRCHARRRGEFVRDPEVEGKEAEKIEILEGLLRTAVTAFSTYKGKEKFLKGCIGSAPLALVLESGSDHLKDKTRNSMKAAILGLDEGDFARKSVDKVGEFIDLVMDAVDEGKSSAEISEMLKSFTANLKN